MDAQRETEPAKQNGTEGKGGEEGGRGGGGASGPLEVTRLANLRASRVDLDPEDCAEHTTLRGKWAL